MDFIRNLTEPAAGALKLVLPVILIGLVAIQIIDIEHLNNLIIGFLVLLSSIAIGIPFLDRLDREDEENERKNDLKFKNRLKRTRRNNA